MNAQNLEIFEIYPFKEPSLPLIFEEKVVILAIKSAAQQQQSLNSNNELSNEFNCLFTASTNIDENSNISLLINGIDPGKSVFNCNGLKTTQQHHIPTSLNGFNIIPTSQLPGIIYVPARVINNCLTNGSTNSNNQSQNIINLFANSISLLSTYCNSNSISLHTISNYISLFSTINFNRNQMNSSSVDLYFDLITLSNRFKAQPVKQIPIVSTALTNSLELGGGIYSTPRTGFCTVYQKNNILLLLDSDPKSHTLPVIGVWISGIREIDHPFVWSACLRYRFSSSVLKQRYYDGDESFIIVLFPSTHKKAEFYKCTSSQSNLEFTLFSGQQKFITAKVFSNKMYLSNKTTAISNFDENVINVNLIEVKDGFKLKMLINAINESSMAWKGGSILNNNKNEDQQPQPHPYEQQPLSIINRSQSCISDLSILSDDDGASLIQQQQQQQRRYTFETGFKQQYENQNHQKCPQTNGTNSMLFGIPRNPPLPTIGFGSMNNSKLVDTIEQQQQQQPIRNELKPNIKKSPPIIQQQQQHLPRSQSLAKDLFNHSNEDHDLLISAYNQSPPTPPQLKKQSSYPTFTNSEPLRKNDSSLSLATIQQQQNHNYSDSTFESSTNHQHSTRNSNEIYNFNSIQQQQQQQQPQPLLIQTTNENPFFMKTPKGLMTQQDLLDIVYKQEEKIQTLQEQINRLLSNNTAITNNSKNSDSSSSNGHRSINSSQRLGSEPSEFNNSQISTNNKNNNNGVYAGSSQSSSNNNIGGGSTSSNSDSNRNNQFQLIQNEEPTVYRSIEPDNNNCNSRSESPIMLFDSSNLIRLPPLVDDFKYQQNYEQQPPVLSSQRATKSDESNNSWRSNMNLNESDNKENDFLKQKNVVVEKRFLNDLKQSQLDQHSDDEDEDEDEDNVALFTDVLKHLNKLNLNQENGQHLQQPLGNGPNSYYMNEPAFLPKIQYISMLMDEGGSENNLSLEANALAMKYLKDEQLTKLAKGITQATKHQQQNYSDTYSKATTICDDNNYSLASKQYLERYGLSNAKKKPSFDRSLSTPVGNKNARTNVYPQLLVDNPNENHNNTEVDGNYWFFGNPNSKSNDSYMSEVGLGDRRLSNNNYQVEKEQYQIRPIINQNSENHEVIAKKDHIFQQFKIVSNNNEQLSPKYEEDDKIDVLVLEGIKKQKKLLF